MEKIEVEIGKEKFIIHELLATQADDIDWTDKKEASKKEIMFSVEDMTEEKYANITMREKMVLLKKIHEINGVGIDF